MRTLTQGRSHLVEELRRRLLLNLLPRPLLILRVQSDLALVHCPSINRTNLEGETNKQNKQHIVGRITVQYPACLYSPVLVPTVIPQFHSWPNAFFDQKSCLWAALIY